jgi:hypothetical protein
MEKSFQLEFIQNWEKYFPSAKLPIGYYYTDYIEEDTPDAQTNQQRCLIGNLNKVWEGKVFIYSVNSPGCSGGKRYSGFSQNIRPDFEYFLSCGIPGEIEGERYKKSPELVRHHLENHPPFEAPGKYLVFKRWDQFKENEQPVVAIFLAKPDVLSGLFTLANFDRPDSLGVIAPMGAGCASIINYPMEESRSTSPRCILGMFDVSARPFVPVKELTFSIPIKKFESMVKNMDESFLITGSWKKIRNRIISSQ